MSSIEFFLIPYINHHSVFAVDQHDRLLGPDRSARCALMVKYNRSHGCQPHCGQHQVIAYKFDELFQVTFLSVSSYIQVFSAA